jgi:small subunit ribosomal protein S7
MRAKNSPVRDVEPDVKFRSTKVTKLINRCMKDGKKSVAQKQVYAALEMLEKRFNQKALDIFEDVLNRVTPQMEVRSRRVGGAAYQVPMPIKPRRASSLAIRWIVEAARARSNSSYHTYAEKLAAEMMDALKGEGGAIAKRDTSHKMADANKAFAHFRW